MVYVRLVLSIQVRRVHSIKELEQHVALKNVENCSKPQLLVAAKDALNTQDNRVMEDLARQIFVTIFRN